MESMKVSTKTTVKPTDMVDISFLKVVFMLCTPETSKTQFLMELELTKHSKKEAKMQNWNKNGKMSKKWKEPGKLLF